MYRQPPELESDPGRSGLLETVAARYAEEDAARAVWLDERIHERRGRAACSCCGLKSGHHQRCTRRNPDGDEGTTH
jgi:hypothetical protein